MSDKQDLFKTINKVKNYDDMTDLEKKHDIEIIAPEVVKAGTPFDVELIVGKKLTHPNMPGHWIQYLELFAGESLISRFEMSAATVSVPKVKFTVQLPEWSEPELIVRERCNLHGVWESRKKIKLE